MPKTTICCFSTVRTPPIPLRQFVNYHLNRGIDHMYLFFDDPEDESIEVMKSEKRVTCIPCDSTHWVSLTAQSPSELILSVRQTLNSNIALRLARDAGYEWIIQIDSDELIYSTGDLKDEIGRVPAHIDLVKMPILEAIPPKDAHPSPFQGVQFYKRAPVTYTKPKYPIEVREKILLAIHKIIYKGRKAFAYLLGCRQVFEIDYIKGHSIGKTFVRITPKILSLQSHYPILVDGADVLMVIFPKLRVLHFDAPNFEAWKAKWVTRYHHNPSEATINALGRKRKPQFKLFVEAYRQNGDNALVLLYDRLYRVKENEMKVLNRVGLIAEVDLPGELFGL